MSTDGFSVALMFVMEIRLQYGRRVIGKVVVVLWRSAASLESQKEEVIQKTRTASASMIPRQRGFGFLSNTNGFLLRSGWMTLTMVCSWPLFSVAKAQGGTVFHLTDHQWAKLLSVSGGFTHEESTVAEVEAVVRFPSRRAKGQGFGLSPV